MQMTVSDRLKEFIDRLGYDFNQFEIAHFIQHIERLQRREILVIPLPFEPGLSAVWIRAETADYIFYNVRTHPIHQTHNILHELAHILLDHTCWTIDQALPPELLVLVSTSPLQGRLRNADRHLRLDQEEQEAEAFVFLIQKRLVTANRISQLMGQSSSIGALRQWVDSMAFDE
jgi:hypothetical protein